MGGHHQLRGIVVENQNLTERDRGTLKRIVSINHRSTATKVTAELIFIFETLFPQKQSDKSFTNPTSMVELQWLIL